MFSSIKGMLTKVVGMSDDQKKERLVQIRLEQRQREIVTGNDNIGGLEELEAMAILESMFQLSAAENVDETLIKIVTLREEINQRTEEKLRE